LIFEGIRGSSYTGDIAIDDLRMLDGPCNKKGKYLIIAHLFFFKYCALFVEYSALC